MCIVSDDELAEGGWMVRFSGDVLTDHLGITVCSSRHGIRIRKLVRRDLAYRTGLRNGDIITHINSIPVSDHRTAVHIIEAARENLIPISFRIRRLSRLHRMWSRLF